MYATVQDILGALREDVLVFSVDDENQGLDGSGNLRPDQEARVLEKIKAATAEADSYIGQRYTLPLATVPELLKAKTTDIAVYLIVARRQQPDEVLRDRYEDAIKLLQNIALGKASLPLPDNSGGSDGVAEDASGGGAKITANPRVFSREKMKGY